MDWYIVVINQYLNFKGRSRRKEYWMFILFNMLFFSITMLLDNYVIQSTIEGDIPAGYLTISYYIFVLIPTTAVTIRRLHDIGKSGWYYLISFIPFVGGFWIILMMCLEGEAQTNKWGANPKLED